MRWGGIRWALALLIACGDPAPALTSLPGAPPFDAAVARRIVAARTARRAQYAVRSRHLGPDGDPQYSNRLLLEDSPYLLQHAHNPVNWYPWGDDAFAEAKRLDRPVLLSIGYSTCHWCHVMEEESFDDEGVATLINQRYVAIKVDREERPDLDALYMGAVQQMTGSGGWPMTVWLTPDREPFYAGTYFPPDDGARGVRTGLRTLLVTLADTFANQRDRTATAARDVVRRLQATPAATGSVPIGPELLAAAVTAVRDRFDAANGGLAAPRKFPSTTPLRALLRAHRRTGDADTLRLATVTLDRIAAGGIRDQLGGAFHRYATDPAWRVPHFEITLYDNALLAMTYLDAFQATRRADYAQTAREILDYLVAEMQAPGGGFWSATDADSAGPTGERSEGRYFTWTPDEIRTALDDPATAAAALRYYGVTDAGAVDGRAVLRIADPTALTGATLDSVRTTLRAARQKRPRPATDTKVVVAWNGLAISALARAAMTLDMPAYATVAARAADTVLAPATRDGRLPRRLVDGRPGQAAVLDDYACLIAGLLDLAEATGDVRWIASARRLDAVVEAHFEDHAAGGFFLTADDGEALLARDRPLDDGAEPSGNSVMAMNLLRLSELTGDARYRARAEAAIASAVPLLNRAPLAAGELLLAVDFLLDQPREIVIVTAPGDAGAAPFLTVLRKRFLPNRVLLVAPARDVATVARTAPIASEKLALDERTTAYVCKDHHCDLPTHDPDRFAAQLDAIGTPAP